MTALTQTDAFRHVRDLPVLPQVVADLVASLADAGLSADQLAQKVSSDQALTAKTLRLASSSFYGLNRQVNSVADATRIVGLRTLQTIAVASGFMGRFTAQAEDAAEFRRFWRHALSTAICARALAASVRADEAGAFVAGLLHDIGRLALANGFAADWERVRSYQRGNDVPCLQAERAVLGTDHAQLGAALIKHWGLSASLADVVAHHHEPGATGSHLYDLVHVADNMAHALDLSEDPDEIVPPICVESWLRLGLNHERCFDVFRHTEAECELIFSALLV